MLIGLTGNIGSGKTILAEVFKQFGIPVYNADDKARELYKISSVVKRIEETLDISLTGRNGGPDLALLAKEVFSDAAKLAALNAIIHPLVIEDIKKWAETHRDSLFCLVESAIVYEHSLQGLFHRVILVTADEDLRISRIMERDGTSLQDIKARMSHQWNQKSKEEQADFVITNNGLLPILPQVTKIIELLKAEKNR